MGHPVPERSFRSFSKFPSVNDLNFINSVNKPLTSSLWFISCKNTLTKTTLKNTKSREKHIKIHTKKYRFYVVLSCKINNVVVILKHTNYSTKILRGRHSFLQYTMTCHCVLKDMKHFLFLDWLSMRVLCSYFYGCYGNASPRKRLTTEMPQKNGLIKLI